MAEAWDLAVGKILRKLDDVGLRENTLAIFTSDNGGLSTSEDWPTSNVPLRAGLDEGGIRLPLVVRWPGVTHPGSVIHIPAIGADVLSTVAAAVGLPSSKLDGVNLLPDRAVYWH
jgi:arylsulfatase A-like enzyme